MVRASLKFFASAPEWLRKYSEVQRRPICRRILKGEKPADLPVELSGLREHS